MQRILSPSPLTARESLPNVSKTLNVFAYWCWRIDDAGSNLIFFSGPGITDSLNGAPRHIDFEHGSDRTTTQRSTSGSSVGFQEFLDLKCGKLFIWMQGKMSKNNKSCESPSSTSVAQIAITRSATKDSVRRRCSFVFELYGILSAPSTRNIYVGPDHVPIHFW